MKWSCRRSLSELCRRSHGDVAIGIERPKGCFAPIGAWRPCDGKVAGIVSLARRLKTKIAERMVWHFFAAHLDHQLADERGLYHQTGKFFHLGDVVAVVMDSVAIESDRRIAKEQGGFRFEHLLPFSLSRNRRRSFWRRLCARFTEQYHVALLH